MAREKKSVIKNLKKMDLKLSLKGKASSIAIAMLSLVLAILVFGLLLFAQNKLSDEIIYQQVVIAKVDIPENEIITEGNAEKYFELKNMNTLDTTNGFMTDVSAILGKQSKVSLLKGEVVSVKDFKDTSSYLQGIKNPVEISIDVGAIANADGGKIRSGDIVNLTMMYSRNQLNMDGSIEQVSQINGTVVDIPDYDFDMSSFEYYDGSEDYENEDISDTSEDDMEMLINEDFTSYDDNEDIVTDGNKNVDNYVFDYYAKYVLENLYVVKALDSAGTEISPTDTVSSANILVFVIDKEDEPSLNNALVNCSNIRISKIVDTSSVSSIYSKIEVDDKSVESSDSEKTLDEEIAEDSVNEDEPSKESGTNNIDDLVEE